MIPLIIQMQTWDKTKRRKGKNKEKNLNKRESENEKKKKLLEQIVLRVNQSSRGIQQSDEILERCAKSRLECQGAVARKLWVPAAETKAKEK